MAYYLVNWGMTVAMACFLVGYFTRRRNNRWHRILMSTGVFMTVASAVALLMAVHMLHGGDRVAAGFLPAASREAILIHRLVATVTFLAMVGMIWSGMTGRRRGHTIAGRLFMPAFLFVYISGLLIFSNDPSN